MFFVSIFLFSLFLARWISIPHVNFKRHHWNELLCFIKQSSILTKNAESSMYILQIIYNNIARCNYISSSSPILFPVSFHSYIEDVQSTWDRAYFYVARPLCRPRWPQVWQTDRQAGRHNKGALGLLVLNTLKVSSGLISLHICLYHDAFNCVIVHHFFLGDHNL